MKIKTKFSNFYPTGIMTVLAFVPAIIAVVVISEINSNIAFPLFFGIWFVFALVGEIYNYRRQKKNVDSGGIILPEHPFGKISLALSQLSVLSLIGAIWLMFRFVRGLYFDGWSWFALNFLASGIIIFGALTILFAGISIYRSVKKSDYRYWLSAYSLLLAGIVILFAFLFVFPIVNSVNDTFMDFNRKDWEELEQKGTTNPLPIEGRVLLWK